MNDQWKPYSLRPEDLAQLQTPRLPGMFASGRTPSSSGLGYAMPPTINPDAPAITQQPLPPIDMTPNVQLQMPKLRQGMFGAGGKLAEATQPGGFLRGLASGLGNGLMSFAAANGDPLSLMMLRQQDAQRTEAREQALWQKRHDVERGDRLEDRTHSESQPQYFSGSEDRMRLDPSTGAVSKLYDAPIPAQNYAQAMGFQPDTDEYRTAMSDYTLRGWGDTAAGNRSDMEQQRFANRTALRQTPTFRDTRARPVAPRPAPQPTPTNVFGSLFAKQAAGGQLTPAQAAVLGNYHAPRSVKPMTAPNGANASPISATDPKTGRKVFFVNGQWRPA